MGRGTLIQVVALGTLSVAPAAGGEPVSEPPAAAALVLETSVAVRQPVEMKLWVRRYPQNQPPVVHSSIVAVPSTIPKEAGDELLRETWLEAEGWWSPIVAVPAGGIGGPVDVRAYPTGELSGTVVVERGEDLPAEVQARFEQAAGTKASLPIPRGKVSCPVEEGAFSCAVPAGSLDVRLKAEGFVAHYFWGARAVRGERLGLGALSLKRGTSVVGYVEAGDTGYRVEGAAVRLEPERMGGPQGRAAQERQERMALEAKTAGPGFFQIAGVRPGQYAVHAEKEGAGDGKLLRVQLFDGKEITLTQPLRLYLPASLGVRVEPPTTPAGKPWRVLLSASEDPRFGTKPLRRDAEEPSLWRAENLPHGRYFLEVQDASDSTWAFREISVLGEALSEQIDVGLVRLEGSVTLEDEPLAATLWFGGRNGAKKVRMESDSAGDYVGLLPESGSWRLDVETAEPKISRRYRAVEVPEPGSDGWARLDLELDDLRLGGRLVDEAGLGVHGYLMLSAFDGLPNQVFTETDGSFELRGLAADRYFVQGYLVEGGRSTDLVGFSLKKGKPAPFLELPLKPAASLRGVVVSDWGPVPGAHVRAQAKAAGSGAALISPEAQTGPDGTFVLELPAAAESLDLCVAAPGYGLKAVRAAVRRGETLTIPVFQQAGSLLFEVGEGVDAAALGARYWIEQNGVPLTFHDLVAWQRVYGVAPPAAGSRSEVPMLEFGEYALCRRGSGEPECEPGFLQPFGTLVFALE